MIAKNWHILPRLIKIRNQGKDLNPYNPNFPIEAKRGCDFRRATGM